MIKLYADKNEWEIFERICSTHLKDLTAKEILSDWKQSLGWVKWWRAAHDNDGKIKRKFQIKYWLNWHALGNFKSVEKGEDVGKVSNKLRVERPCFLESYRRQSCHFSDVSNTFLILINYQKKCQEISTYFKTFFQKLQQFSDFFQKFQQFSNIFSETSNSQIFFS